MMMEDIRDIKTVLGVFDLGTFLFLLLVCVVIYLLISLFYRWGKRLWSRRGEERKGQKNESEKPFNLQAEEELSALDPVYYFEKGKIKEYYIALTEIVRQFLAWNYHIDTYDKTSFEIIGQVERVERDYEKVKNLDAYFEDCDLVKFAKYRPTLAGMKEGKEISFKIIKEYFKRDAFR